MGCFLTNLKELFKFKGLKMGFRNRKSKISSCQRYLKKIRQISIYIKNSIIFILIIKSIRFKEIDKLVQELLMLKLWIIHEFDEFIISLRFNQIYIERNEDDMNQTILIR